MNEPALRELDGAAFRRHVDDATAIYAAAMRPPATQLPGRRLLLERHTTHQGFCARVVFADGRMVAFGYGFPGRAGQWWHDVVSAALSESVPPREVERWVGDSFEVAEIHVLPAYQGRGIGRRLITALCASRPERTVVLSTRDVDSPARRLYRSLGFVDLLAGFRFPAGDEDYAVMARRLPLPTR